ncbi:MAG: 30S ribosome-binding factor RbfA [Methylococcales bacterium]|nr:30S ribosome-binding factor RbfA [Methylococcales bacterium]
MAREFSRATRVASEMQKELAMILQRELDSRRLGFATVNEVALNHDLSVAKVYFTVLNADDAQKQRSTRYLNEAAPMIRSLMGKKIRLRVLPEIRFYYDDSIDTGYRISRLLAERDSE